MATATVRGAGSGKWGSVKNELSSRFRKLSKSKKEKVARLLAMLAENPNDDTVINAVIEILWPEVLGGVVDDPTQGISEAARRKLEHYRSRVGQAIRDRRVALEMTQEELAEKAGIPQSHVSRLESGKHAASYLTMRRLAKALKTTEGELDPGFD